MAKKYLIALILIISAKVSASTFLIPTAGRIHINGELVNGTCTIFTNTPGLYIDLNNLSNQANTNLIAKPESSGSQSTIIPFSLNIEGCADFSFKGGVKNFSVLPLYNASENTHLASTPLASLAINKLNFNNFDLSFLRIDELHRKLLFEVSYIPPEKSVSTGYENASFILNFNYL